MNIRIITLSFVLLFSLTACNQQTQQQVQQEEPEISKTILETETQTIDEELTQEDIVYAEIKGSYPLLKGNHEAINNTITSGIMSDMGSFKDFMEDIEYDIIAGPGMYENNCETIRLDEKIFSVLCSIYTYTGGVHPNTFSGTFNFNMQTEEALTINDVLIDGGLQRIAMLSQEQIKNTLEEMDALDSEWLEEGAAPKEENYQKFTLSDDTLTIYFDPYQVGPYVIGPQKAEIPYVSIEDVLKIDLD